MNPNKAVWEKGDFTRIASTMRESGEAVVAACGVTKGLPKLLGPTMNAFAAAEQNGKAADLQKELEALFESQDTSEVKGATSIPATFLRVTVAV
jgi:hypothetical protein